MITEQSTRQLAILGYHKVGNAPGGWDTWFYIPEDTFVNQLTYLRHNNWQVIDLAAFLLGLDDPATLPERAALLTFDDGCRQFLDVALPCLQRFGYSSVHFVPTDHIGGKNSFDEGIEPEEPIFTWEDLRNLAKWNVSVQSHATSHRPFSTLNDIQKEEELLRSKAVLEKGLEQPVQVLAFPQGDEGNDFEFIAQALRRTGYRAACLYGGGPISLPADNPYRLTRLAMGPDTNLAAALRNGHPKEI